MDSPLCRLCGVRHYSYEPHVWKDVATNTESKVESATNKVVTGATNGGTNVLGSATNSSEERIGKPAQSLKGSVAKVESSREEGLQRSLRDDVLEQRPVPSPVPGEVVKPLLEDDGVERGLDSSGRRTLNRRSREAYNAYQKDYMREYRARQRH